MLLNLARQPNCDKRLGASFLITASLWGFWFLKQRLTQVKLETLEEGVTEPIINILAD